MKEILQKIVGSPAMEARWLNTLSLLEYIGARKISKTVGFSHPSLEILSHQAEEVHHAQVLKELCEKISMEATHKYLCHDEAVSYFQILDATLSEWISDLTQKEEPFQNYLLVAAMIEQRAITLYSSYDEVTDQTAVKKELKQILQEEKEHLIWIEKKLREILGKKEFSQNWKLCATIEQRLFDIFENALKKTLNS